MARQSYLHWPLVLPAAAIISAGIFVYSPAIRGGWLWDDQIYVVQNLALRSAGGLKSIWLAPSGLNYFPITFTVQWLQWHLWGDSTLGYHLTNVGLHLTSCFLLWHILRRLGARMPWLGGLLFAVHPLAVESVAWISELKNVLSLALVLGALDAYLDFDEHPRPASYARAWLLFLAAMLSKSTAAMFPAALLLFCWWKRRRVRALDLWASLPFFAVAVGLGGVTVWFEHHRAMIGTAATENLPARAASAGAALVFYFWKSVFPVGLLPSYPRPTMEFPRLWAFGPWIALAAAFAGLAATRRAWARHVICGAGWFVLNLLPILGFIPMAYLRISRAADHFAYLALPGALGLAAAGFGQLAARLRPALARWPAVAAGGLCLLLAAEGRRDARVFESERTLWSAVLARNPASWLAHNHLGAVWLREGRLDAARPEFEQALRYAPDYVEAHNNLGVALEGAGRLSEALAEFRRALQLRPADAAARANLAGAHARLGNVWLSQNQPGRAAEEFAESLQIEPENFAVHNNFGIALSRLGRLAEAIAHYETALRLQPDYPEALTNLGNALLRSGRPAEAAARYEAALRIAPGYAPARENLQVAIQLAPGAGSAPTHPEPSPPR
jgi:Tfp pilus assembly protein PilF